MIIMKLISTLALLLISFHSFAQEIVTTGGDFHQFAAGSVSYTIGEPVIETYINTSYILTQGFNQTRLTITEINIQQGSDYKISVFPSPVIYSFTIKTNDINGLSYQLFDAVGKLVKTGKLINSETSVTVENLSSAIYFLHIVNKAQEIKTFKIEKQ